MNGRELLEKISAKTGRTCSVDVEHFFFTPGIGYRRKLILWIQDPESISHVREEFVSEENLLAYLKEHNYV